MADDGGGATTYYDLLGVDFEASEDDIQRAFERKVEELGQSAEGSEQLALVEEGYHVLMDPATREEYDNRLKALALFQEFEEQEPEWIEGYHMQLNALTDAENDVVEPKLDDIFAQLTHKSNDEVKKEVQKLFAQLRSERCKEDLRYRLLPHVRQLPKEDQKPTLARILDMFGNLQMTDEEVFERGLAAINAILHGEPEEPEAPPPPAPKTKKKKKAQVAEAQQQPSEPPPQPEAEVPTVKKKKKKAAADELAQTTVNATPTVHAEAEEVTVKKKKKVKKGEKQEVEESASVTADEPAPQAPRGRSPSAKKEAPVETVAASDKPRARSASAKKEVPVETAPAEAAEEPKKKTKKKKKSEVTEDSSVENPPVPEAPPVPPSPAPCKPDSGDEITVADLPTDLPNASGEAAAEKPPAKKKVKKVKKKKKTEEGEDEDEEAKAEELEKAKKEEEAKQKAEEERKQKEAGEAKKAEEAAKKKAEEERKKKKEEEEARKAEEEAKKKAEEEAKKKVEEEAKKKAEEEAKKKAEEEAKKKAEEEAKKKEEEARKEKEAEEAKKAEEVAAEAKKAAEEAAKKAEEAKKEKEAAARKLEEEAAKKAAEEEEEEDSEESEEEEEESPPVPTKSAPPPKAAPATETSTSEPTTSEPEATASEPTSSKVENELREKVKTLERELEEKEKLRQIEKTQMSAKNAVVDWLNEKSAKQFDLITLECKEWAAAMQATFDSAAAKMQSQSDKVDGTKYALAVEEGDSRQSILFEWQQAAQDLQVLCQTDKEASLDVGRLHTECNRLHAQNEQLQKDWEDAQISAQESSQQAADAYSRVTQLLEEVSTLQTQLGMKNKEVWHMTQSSRDAASQRERDARMDLDRANKLVRKKEQDCEALARQLATAEHENKVSLERITALQDNIETLFKQIRTAERNHAREMQVTTEESSRVMDQGKQEQMLAMQEAKVQRLRAQELEHQLNAVLSSQARHRHDVEERARDSERQLGEHASEVVRLLAVNTEVESRYGRVSAQNSVLSDEIDNLRAKEREMREVIRMIEDKLRRSEEEARQHKAGTTVLETFQAENAGKVKVLEEELREERERTSRDRRLRAEEALILESKLSASEDNLARARSTTRQLDMEIQSYKTKLFNMRERLDVYEATEGRDGSRTDRGSGEAADRGSVAEEGSKSKAQVSDPKESRQLEKVKELSESVHQLTNSLDEKNKEIATMNRLVETKKSEIQALKCRMEEMQIESEMQAEKAREQEKEDSNRAKETSRRLQDALEELERFQVRLEGSETACARQRERETALEAELHMVMERHSLHRRSMEADIETLRAQCQQLQQELGERGRKLQSMGFACQKEKDRADELQRQVVDSQSSYDKLKSKIVSGAQTTHNQSSTPSYWLERIRELEAGNHKLLEALRDAVLAEVSQHCQMQQLLRTHANGAAWQLAIDNGDWKQRWMQCKERQITVQHASWAPGCIALLHAIRYYFAAPFLMLTMASNPFSYASTSYTSAYTKSSPSYTDSTTTRALDTSTTSASTYALACEAWAQDPTKRSTTATPSLTDLYLNRTSTARVLGSSAMTLDAPLSHRTTGSMGLTSTQPTSYYSSTMTKSTPTGVDAGRKSTRTHDKIADHIRRSKYHSTEFDRPHSASPSLSYADLVLSKGTVGAGHRSQFASSELTELQKRLGLNQTL